jgi:hypothetical protein
MNDARSRAASLHCARSMICVDRSPHNPRIMKKTADGTEALAYGRNKNLYQAFILAERTQIRLSEQ